MFAKKKYSRKQTRRKPLKRRVIRRKQILRPKDVPFPYEKPSFDASGVASYAWMNVTSGCLNGSLLKSPRTGIAPSLRQICAKALAANADSICPSYLKEASWECWQLVWENILQQGMDLPTLFRSFAAAFGGESSFRSHTPVEGIIERVHGTIADRKRSALLTCLIPTNLKHRLENVFSNVSVFDFSAFVGTLRNSCTIIDCSRMPVFTSSQLLALCNIPTVRAIDISYNQVVDDQFLYTLNTCLVTKKSQLKLIRVCGCNAVTNRSIMALLEAREESLLIYIETHNRLATESMFISRFMAELDLSDDAPIPGTRWKAINSDKSSFTVLGRCSFAMKVHFLLRVKRFIDVPDLLWDFKFFDKVAGHETTSEEFHDSAWRLRLQFANMRKTDIPYMYIKDEDMAVVPRLVNPQKPKISAHPELKALVSGSNSSGRKMKHVKTDANLFFFGA